MKALRVERLSPDLSGIALCEVPIPSLSDGEVLVRVRAASLNYPDLLMTRGEYQFKPEPPFTLGMELAGEVIEAAPGSAFTVGDRVRGGAKTGAMAGFDAFRTRSRSVPPLPWARPTTRPMSRSSSLGA